MRRFNASKVKMSTHLVPSNDKQKARARAANGIQMPFARGVGPATIVPPKERDYLAPQRNDYVPCKLRGRSGTRLSPEKRAMVAARRAARDAFFASI